MEEEDGKEVSERVTSALLDLSREARELYLCSQVPLLEEAPTALAFHRYRCQAAGMHSVESI